MSTQRVPTRYVDYYKSVLVDNPDVPTVAISVPPFQRATLCCRWKCRRCGLLLKPNNAAAISHLAKHVREAARARMGVSR